MNCENKCPDKLNYTWRVVQHIVWRRLWLRTYTIPFRLEMDAHAAHRVYVSVVRAVQYIDNFFYVKQEMNEKLPTAYSFKSHTQNLCRTFDN